MIDLAVIDRVTIDCIYSDFKEYPKKGEELCTKSFSLSLGGGACVAPVRLSKMGLDCRFGTFLGNDNLSEIAGSLLEKYQLRDVRNFYHGEDSPVIFSTVFSSSDDRGILSFDMGINESIISDDELYDFFKDARVCYAPRREGVVKRLKDEGHIIVYDSHWEEGQTLDDYIPVIKYADYFTPNDKEAMALTKTDSARDALLALCSCTENPIVKTGANGCLAKIDGEVVHIPAMSVNAADTTGAGDNFLSGLVFGICKKLPMKKCIELANTAGALSVAAPGCFNAQYDLNEYL